jgi:hypothetical protein
MAGRNGISTGLHQAGGQQKLDERVLIKLNLYLNLKIEAMIQQCY